MSTLETEEQGVAVVHLAVVKAGWTYRWVGGADVGVDAIIEAHTNGLPDGRMLGLQIKSGNSYFERRVSGGWRRYVEQRHLDYWDQYAAPVVFVMVDDDDGIFWAPVRDETVRPTRQGGSIMIPEHRRFDAAGFAELERLAEESLPVGDLAAREQESQAQKARLDLDLVGRVAAGQQLRIDASCWPEGRAAVRVSCYHGGRGISSERVLRNWPWVSIPVADGASDDERARAMSAELEALFPWARLTIERERYREESHPLFIAQRARWDPEFADYDWDEGDPDFDAWFAERFDGDLVPFGVQLPSGLMQWRLAVELNSVGEQALKASNDQDFADAMSSIDLEDALAESRADGVYRTDVVEGRMHSYVTVVFDSEQTGRLEALYMAPDPDSDPGNQAMAVVVLQDTLGREPTEALVDLFVDRFAGELDSGDWTIAAVDVDHWLDHFVRAPPEMPNSLRRKLGRTDLNR